MAAMVLIHDGQGTFHRAIVHDVGDIRTGNRVSLDYGRDVQVRLPRGPEQDGVYDFGCGGKGSSCKGRPKST